MSSTTSTAKNRVRQADNDANKILLKNGNQPVVVLNGTIGKTAWMAIPQNVGDDHKELLLSLLLYAANKGPSGVLSPQLRKLNIGYLTSYINTKNDDIFEIYKFNLGLGFPF